MYINTETNRINWKTQYSKFIQAVKEKCEYDYYISVTRKGYLFLKSLSKSQLSKRKLLRDRDILKYYRYDDFISKKILLIDDTANTGTTLKHLKLFLEEKTDATAQIDIAAFAISPLILSKKDQLFKGCNLFFSYMLDEDMMMRFSLYELNVIHKSLIPYVIDLPYFEKIKLSKDDFFELANSFKDNWNFYDYTFKLQNEELKNGFFLYENNTLNNIFGDSLLSCIVKCRYAIHTNGDLCQYEVVFTPFVLMKSVSYYDMRNCFLNIYANTPYIQFVTSNGNIQENFIGIYRDVVYNLSYFIGSIFQQYISEQFGILLKWNNNLTDSSQNRNLQKSLALIFDNFSPEQYFKRLQTCYFTKWKTNNINISQNNFSDFSQIQDLVLSDLALKKLGNTTSHITNPEKTVNDFISFEYIEDMIAENFRFKDNTHFKLTLTQIILYALDSSFMSNDLQLQGNEIKRGFRFGENSEIDLGYNIHLFYMAVYSYFNNVKTSAIRYHNNYKKFILSLYAYLQNNHYFRYGYITQEAFIYFKNYFDLKGYMIDREIRNKRFLLDDNIMKTRYIRAVGDYVRNLSFE